MAVARLSSGELYGSIDHINAIIGPMEVGKFDLPSDIGSKLASMSMPVSENDASYFVNNWGGGKKIADDGGYSFQQVRCFVPQKEKGGPAGFSTNPGGAMGDMPAEALIAYQTPHHVNANEIHFLFSGCITKGLQLADGRQAVVYITAGEWMRIDSSNLTWPVFNSGEASVAMSCYDRQPQLEGGQFEMSLYPEHAVLETMKF